MISYFARSLRLTPTPREGYTLRTLREPALLQSANGIRIGPDGRLWICEGTAPRISALDVEDLTLSTVVPARGPLAGADDCAFDAAGNLYVADMKSAISVMRTDGTVETLTDQVTFPNGIAFGPDGRLFVDEFRTAPDGRVLEIDPTTGDVRVLVENIGYPNGCDVGPDGRVYYQDVFAGTVSAVDPDTLEVEQVADGLQGVCAVKFDPHGRLHAVVSQQGQVLALDLEGGDHDLVATMPLGGADNLCFAPDGTLYVSSYSSGQIIRVSPGQDGHTVLIPPGLIDVTSATPLPNGNMLVANGLALTEVAPDGSLQQWCKWLMRGEAMLTRLDFFGRFTLAGQSQAAWALDDSTALLLTRGGNLHLVQRDEVSVGLERLISPGVTAMTHGPLGHLVATVDGQIREVGVHGLGKQVATTGCTTVTALASTDRAVAAASTATGEVFVFRGDEPPEVLSGFERPTGVALVGDVVYVAEHARRRVVRHDLGTGEELVVADELPFGVPVPEAPDSGVATLTALEDGTVLISCDGDASLRLLTFT